VVHVAPARIRPSLDKCCQYSARRALVTQLSTRSILEPSCPESVCTQVGSASAPDQAVLSPEAVDPDDSSFEHTAYVAEPACPDHVCPLLPVRVHQVLAAMLPKAVNAAASSVDNTASVT
jgi:hypothetical protein